MTPEYERAMERRTQLLSTAWSSIISPDKRVAVKDGTRSKQLRPAQGEYHLLRALTSLETRLPWPRTTNVGMTLACPSVAVVWNGKLRVSCSGWAFESLNRNAERR